MSEGDRPGPAPADPADPVAALEARLGLAIADRGTALAALTHKSFVNEHREDAALQDNERLEFLGDAVIDLAVSHRLMERFPGAREGELSKMRAAVVDEQGLSEMARALELGELLRLGRGEELTGGRRKASLLADAMEAVVAAVYLGGGLGPVLTIVDRFLGEAFARAAAGTLDRDFKTQLQELAQSRLRATPRYRVVAERGPDHSKVFEVETDLRGEVLGRAEGRSKKDAEQAAAKLALERLAQRADGSPPALAALGAAGAILPPGAPAAPPEAATATVEPPPATPPVPQAAADELAAPDPVPAALDAGAAASAAPAEPRQGGEGAAPGEDPHPEAERPPGERRRTKRATKKARPAGRARTKTAAKPARKGTPSKR